MLDKVHRIQEAGMEVWCGIIVGFDHDDESIFAVQRRFLDQSRISNIMVNMLVAIPRTPLYQRLEREGRLDNTGDPSGFGPFGTNVVPQRIGREALYRGYVELMQDLYQPAAFFARLDELYLTARLRWGQARQKYLRRHPIRRAKLNARLLLEAAAIFVMLLRGVPDRGLRREYRRRLWRVVRHRPTPAMLQLYAIKCAMHFHIQMMVREMRAIPPEVTRAAA